MYGLDLVIVLLAVGAALAAHGERHRWPVPRGRLLLPGVLAIFGTAILLSYPDIRDVAAPIHVRIDRTSGGDAVRAETRASGSATGFVQLLDDRRGGIAHDHVTSAARKVDDHLRLDISSPQAPTRN